MTTAVILAAGAGTRLGDLGKKHSKAMVPVAGRPLIDWVIRRLFDAGIERLVVVGHPSDSALADFLQQHYPEATLVLQPERRGIADALRRALSSLAAENAYLACACDSVIAVDDLRAVIDRGVSQPRAAVIGVLEMGREATATRSAVKLDGERVLAIVEKPNPDDAPSGLVALPLYWLPRAFDPHLETVTPLGGEIYIATALNDFIVEGGAVFAVHIQGRIEITTSVDVDRAAEGLVGRKRR